MGDEGSGFSIGRAALQHTLRGIETGNPGQGLADVVRRTLDVKSVTELTRNIYGSADPRHAIAGLATLVSSAADDGDPDACQILAEAAAELAQLASRTAQAIGVADSGFPLALAGGVLMNSKKLQDGLHAELELLGLQCSVHKVPEPLAGCIRLAEPRFADVLVTWHTT